MTTPPDDAELARRFRETSASQVRAPLYAALTAGIADDPSLYRLLAHAPPQQQLPVLLLACTHALLLEQPDHELAQWYPNLTSHPRSPWDEALLPTFEQFVTAHTGALADMLATRTTQTNEVGRCLLLVPALGVLADECGPLAHLDVGTSGGLNLLCDRYCYRYTSDDGGAAERIVGAASPVRLEATTRGTLTIPGRLPAIAARLGVDADPIDVTDDGAARWLEACIWPDQRDRFLRLRAAIGIARSDPPEIVAGDAVSALAPAIQRIRHHGHPVVTNSWVLNYLSPKQRTAYVAELDRLGSNADLSWVFVESPTMTPELPWPSGPGDEFRTVVAVARWRGGQRTVEQLATCHPHGYWLHGH
ncbi:MAG: DUF2332 domain-containing protein [Ilumatobacter sp.]|nr:DUF2332 domain-containing protein [Ilumatobacter sp.]